VFVMVEYEQTLSRHLWCISHNLGVNAYLQHTPRAHTTRKTRTNAWRDRTAWILPPLRARRAARCAPPALYGSRSTYRQRAPTENDTRIFASLATLLLVSCLHLSVEITACSRGTFSSPENS